MNFTVKKLFDWHLMKNLLENLNFPGKFLKVLKSFKIVKYQLETIKKS